MKVRALRPYCRDWGRYRGHAKADQGPRYFSSIFAYDTDIVADDWGAKEANRIRKVIAKSGSHPEHLDRVAVLSRGLILPADGLTVSHQKDQRVLGTWFFSLINFLTREANRREQFPWPDYEPREGRSWSQTISPQFSAPSPRVFTQTQINKYKSGR